MRTIVLGNSGSGKSRFGRRLADTHAAAYLCLDDVAFTTGANRRPVNESVALARDFVADEDRWVIEGCYGDIIGPLLASCSRLVFLNPGVEACVANCMKRPWEPNKYSSRAMQDAQLEALIEWVRTYETRADEYGYAAHRKLYDGFAGKKQEFTRLPDYD